MTAHVAAAAGHQRRRAQPPADGRPAGPGGRPSGFADVAHLPAERQRGLHRAGAARRRGDGPVAGGIARELGAVGPGGRSAPAAQWAALVAANPFAGLEDDPKKLHVTFLDRRARRRTGWPPWSTRRRRSPPSASRWSGPTSSSTAPAATARHRFTNAFLERRLGRVATTRNWRTVDWPWPTLAGVAGLSPRLGRPGRCGDGGRDGGAAAAVVGPGRRRRDPGRWRSRRRRSGPGRTGRSGTRGWCRHRRSRPGSGPPWTGPTRCRRPGGRTSP